MFQTLLYFTSFNVMFNVVDQSGTLLNMVRGLLRSWEDPLQHLTTTVRDMKEFPADMIRRVQEIEYKTHQLREGMEKIIKQVSNL
jgi:hypothetical protein